jgi:hypothetical protein
MMFQPDGTFVDLSGNYVNGTAFFGITKYLTTPRAVTVIGSTGHVKSYKGTTAGWLQAQ